MRTFQYHAVRDFPGKQFLRQMPGFTLEQQADILQEWWNDIRQHSVFGRNGLLPSFSTFLKNDEGFNMLVTPQSDVADYAVRPWSTEWGFFYESRNTRYQTGKEVVDFSNPDKVIYSYLPAYRLKYVALLRRGPFAVYRLSVPERNGEEACAQPVVARLESVKEVTALDLISHRPSCDEDPSPYAYWHCLLDSLFLWVNRTCSQMTKDLEGALQIERQVELFKTVHNLSDNNSSFTA